MKSLKPLFLFLLFPLFGSAQSLNGVYTGVLSNDSTTIRKDQTFEMALTEYNSKVYGYAYSTFIVNDTLYYIVKRVKGKVEGDICEVEDDEVITHNFPQKPEKKVFVTYTLRRNASDSIWRLDGNWKTNATKKYYAISGNVETAEEKDLAKSKLYEHLGDLDLQKTLVLTKPKEKVPDTKTSKPKDSKADIAKNTVKKDEKNNTDKKPVDNKPDAFIAKADTKIPGDKSNPNPVITQPGSVEKKDATLANNTNLPDKKTDPVIAKSETKSTDNKITISSNPPVQNEKKDIASSNSNPVDKKPENNIAKTDSKLPDNKTVPAATNNPPVQDVNKNALDKNKTDVAKAETKLSEKKPDNAVVINQPVQKDKKDVAVSNNTTSINQQTNTIKPAENKNTGAVNSNTVAKTETKPGDNKPAAVTVNNQSKPENTIAKNDTKPNSTVANSLPVQTEKKDIAVNNEKADAGYEFRELKRKDRSLKPAASLVDERVSVPSETIYFRSDSISIALYDNGEVDGDTVSVIINDELFIDKQGLKSSAFRKTFYIPRDQGDSLLVVLYAENLGKYPPNTGLLQIKDGEDVFYVRFKADLDKNAAIMLRRKSKL